MFVPKEVITGWIRAAGKSGISSCGNPGRASSWKRKGKARVYIRPIRAGRLLQMFLRPSKDESNTQVGLWDDRVIEIANKHFVPSLIAPRHGVIWIIKIFIGIVGIRKEFHQLIVLN
jgi:hypothetical protein